MLQSGANQMHSLQLLLKDAQQDCADLKTDNKRLKDSVDKLRQALPQVTQASLHKPQQHTCRNRLT